jgi:hypothetical protein
MDYPAFAAVKGRATTDGKQVELSVCCDALFLSVPLRGSNHSCPLQNTTLVTKLVQ